MFSKEHYEPILFIDFFTYRDWHLSVGKVCEFISRKERDNNFTIIKDTVTLLYIGFLFPHPLSFSQVLHHLSEHIKKKHAALIIFA